MSIFNDKALKGVAAEVAKIMGEELKGNQHKIDANKNGKIDAHDFKLLRAGKKDMKKEEVGLDEAKTQSKEEKDKVVGAVTKAMRQSYANVMQGRNERAAARMNAKIKNKMKEEVEQLDELSKETLTSYRDKANVSQGKAYDAKMAAGSKGDMDTAHKQNAIQTKRGFGLGRVANRGIKPFGPMVNKEEVEQLQEYESKAGVFKHKAKLEKGAKYGETDYNKDDDDDKKEKSPKRAQKGYGAHQNKRSQKTDYNDSDKDTGERMKPGRIKKTKTGLIHKMNESLSFTEMLELYNEHGLKVLAPIETEEMDIDGTTVEVIDADQVNGVVATIVEEPTNDEWTKEYEDQKASFEGKKKQPKVAAGKTVGVKNMPESVEQIDERELTKGEAKKKEDYVMGMKKKLSGFKQRYGERAKSVMYATATSMAKKD
jgi:hypothetical protein